LAVTLGATRTKEHLESVKQQYSLSASTNIMPQRKTSFTEEYKKVKFSFRSADFP
jgi:hypothetical protein